MDALANFAYGTVLTAPSPASSGTSLVLNSGQGANFPAAPFDLLIWPANAIPLVSNAEIARCTTKVTDTLTLTRAQYGTSARTVVVGDQCCQPIDANLLGQLIAATAAAGSADVVLSGGLLTLVGTAAVEAIIRANSLDQMAAPAANVPMNTKRLTTLAQGIVGTDAPDLAQLAGNQYAYVVSGCVWTADSPGSTLNASMTSGTVMIKGILLTVAAVTARAFTASKETYIDLTDNGDGTAAITYTTVANWGISPALASSGTLLNTIRVAVISSGSSSIASAGIGQGGLGNGGTGTSAVTIAGTQPSSTVAAGSNGQTIGSLTSNQLAVASTSTFVAAGGLIQVVRGAVQIYTLKSTGTSSPNITGLTAANTLSGAGTVATGDAVTGYCPIGVTDNIGNLIYPTSPYPRLIAQSQNTGASATATTAFPISTLVTPFVVPAGPSRNVRMSMHFGLLSSSAVAGTNITMAAYSDNAVTPALNALAKVPVASDGGLGLDFAGYVRLAPGTYYAQFWLTQGAAGTISYGFAGEPNQFAVELVS